MEKSFDQQLSEAKAAIPSLNPQQAHGYKSSALFLDPRDPEDIYSTTGKIPGAINISLPELKDSNQPLENQIPHDRTIITSCQMGPMGAIAAHALQQRGFKNVYYIDGGTQGWLDAGYGTEKS